MQKRFKCAVVKDLVSSTFFVWLFDSLKSHLQDQHLGKSCTVPIMPHFLSGRSQRLKAINYMTQINKQ